MGITIILTAAIFASLSNLFLRKSIDCGGTSKSFLVIQLSFACAFAIFLNPIMSADYSFAMPTASLGFSAGLVLGFMMFFLGKSLEKGPLGLTFSIFNGSTVMPGLVMALVFGAALGYGYTYWHAIGSLLVLFGLFWASWEERKRQKAEGWLFFAGLAFTAHVIFLVIMQWRALMINAPASAAVFRVLTKSQALNQWFMPMIYFAAALFQIVIYLKTERRIFSKKEVYYGLLGGAANALCTFFLIRATEVAGVLENAIIFPIFSVAIILICNSWGQILYQEKVNWKACHACVAGLILATVDWKTLFSFFNL